MLVMEFLRCLVIHKMKVAQETQLSYYAIPFMVSKVVTQMITEDKKIPIVLATKAFLRSILKR